MKAMVLGVAVWLTGCTTTLDGTSDTGRCGGIAVERPAPAEPDAPDNEVQTGYAIEPLGFSCSGHTATLLDDGRVLLVGVCQYSLHAHPVDAAIYDHATGELVLLEAPFRRTEHAAMRVADGRVLVAGGVDGAGQLTRQLWLFDPDSGAFADAGTLLEGRRNPSAAELDDGSVLVAGGYDLGASALASSELVSAGGAVVAGPWLLEARGRAAAIADGTGVLIAGGHDATAMLATTERAACTACAFAPDIVLPQAGEWALTAGPSGIVGLSGGSLVELDDVAGSWVPTPVVLGSSPALALDDTGRGVGAGLQLYAGALVLIAIEDPASPQKLAVLPASGITATATTLARGEFLIVGGEALLVRRTEVER